ncbi:hypothetical protein ACFFMP_02900 [Pseudoroseomonas cervicalis]|uniref:hypothetical protein n=1 Tax=Teichococcus cervicalis TaxID=204525 RepID=UPI0035E7E978
MTFHSIRTRLVLWLLVFALLPPLLLGAAFLPTRAALRGMALDQLADNAAILNELIDRNLFERYGDVQAFGLNTAAHRSENWDNPGAGQPAGAGDGRLHGDLWRLQADAAGLAGGPRAGRQQQGRRRPRPRHRQALHPPPGRRALADQGAGGPLPAGQGGAVRHGGGAAGHRAAAA